MRDDIREFLGRDASRVQRVRAAVGELPEVHDELGEVLLDARMDAAERMAPLGASGRLLVVRLSGEGVVDGWMDREMHADVIDPLVREVEQAVSSKVRPDVRLGLVGVSSGSVVLHLRPQVEHAASGEGEFHYDVHPADEAVMQVSKLHRMLESEEPSAIIASAFKDSQGVLKQARKLVENLAKHSLNLSTRWRGPAAVSTKAVLTRRGQEYARRVFAATEQDNEERLQGKVTAIDIDGTVTITGYGSKNPKYHVDVGPERVSSSEFELGTDVHLWAMKHEEVDSVGVSHRWARYTFIRHVPNHPLDLS